MQPEFKNTGENSGCVPYYTGVQEYGWKLFFLIKNVSIILFNVFFRLSDCSLIILKIIFK